jgi:hypothetical protein
LPDTTHYSTTNGTLTRDYLEATVKPSPFPRTTTVCLRLLSSSDLHLRRRLPQTPDSTMSTPRNQQSSARPAFAPLQSTNSSHTSSYSSISSQSSTAPAPLSSPTSGQQNHFYSSMNQQTQQQQYQQPQGPQRHPSFEYRPNRDGAGQTAAETTNYLSQMALLNEAAKRAQMACVMRDIGEMEL